MRARAGIGLIGYYGTQSYRNIPGIYQIFVTKPDARLCKLARDWEALSSQELQAKHSKHTHTLEHTVK